MKTPIRVRDIYQDWPMAGRGVDFAFDYTEQTIEGFDLDVDPPYQRGHVWTEAQRVAFMGHALTGGRIASLFVREPTAMQDNGGARYELIDGKQRLTTVRMWLRNEIPADIGDGRLVRYEETDKRFRIGHGLRFDFVRLATTADVLRFYLRLNSGGTPHTAEELAKVRAMLSAESAARD